MNRKKDDILDAIFNSVYSGGISGGGGGQTVKVGPLEVNENGTYTAPNNAAYNPVTVNVSGGSSAGGSEDDDVRFIDYDGTILYSYSAEEFLSLDAMPDAPEHEGLTFDGWNWTFENAREYVRLAGVCEIGAVYSTTDGATRFVVDVDRETSMTVSMCFELASESGEGDALIDWGDGTAATIASIDSTVTPFYPEQINYPEDGEELSDIYAATLKAESARAIIGTNTVEHTYDKRGEYTITLTPTGDAAITLTYQTSTTGFFQTSPTDDRRTLKRIYIGRNVTLGPNACFMQLGLEAATIPEDYQAYLGNVYIPNMVFNYSTLRGMVIPRSITMIGESGFASCESLRRMSLPDTMVDIGNYAFQTCYSLERVILPLSAAYKRRQSLSNCHAMTIFSVGSPGIGDSNGVASSAGSLRRLIIPEGVTTINRTVTTNAFPLKEVTIPSTVATINGAAISNYSGTLVYHMRPETPPALTEAFNDTAIIRVQRSDDHSVLTAYKTATGWNNMEDRIFEEEE